MVHAFTHALSRAVLVCVVAISLLLMGAPHGPMMSAQDRALQVELAGLDLTAADLCLSQDMDPTMQMGDCPLCHLVAWPGLGTPMPNLHDIDLAIAAAVHIPPQTVVFGRVDDPAIQVRAPPVV